VQAAAQAIQRQLDRAEAQPFAPAEQARPPRAAILGGGDRQMDGAAELDAVFALIDVDEHRERDARPGLAPRRLRRRLHDLPLNERIDFEKT
jgi:hypothetical protein